MRYILNLVLVVALIGISCGNNTKSSSATNEANIPFVQNISLADIPAIKNTKPSVKFLDVRTPQETAEGVINGALKIDYRSKDFKKELEQLDKSQSYIVYCKSGGRSAKSAEIMQQMGFESIYNLEGGYDAISASKQ